MTELPHHPDDEMGGVEESSAPAANRSIRTYLWWLLGIGLVVLMAVLHLTGVVGAGSH
ncbi:MAG: hypothetical protein ABI873_05715 [Marmoricola sp.]